MAKLCASVTGLTPARTRYLPRLHQCLNHPAHYDPILTSSFASPFRFVRTPVRGGTVPIRQSAGRGGEKNRVPGCQPARGGKTACRINRCRNRLFAAKQEQP